MKRKQKHWVRYILVVLSSLCFVLPTGCQKTEKSGKETIISVREISETARKIPLDKEYIRLSEPGAETKQDVRIVLTEREYESAFLISAGDQTQEWTREIVCYEMKAIEHDSLYSWSFWTFRPVIEFRLFSRGLGENYLAWVDGSGVYFEEVSENRDKMTALSEFIAEKPGRYLLPVSEFVSREHFEGLNALHDDITILFVGKDETGSLRVKVEGQVTGKTFEFIHDGKVWQSL